MEVRTASEWVKRTRGESRRKKRGNRSSAKRETEGKVEEMID